jgi:hypothetical protein
MTWFYKGRKAPGKTSPQSRDSHSTRFRGLAPSQSAFFPHTSAKHGLFPIEKTVDNSQLHICTRRVASHASHEFTDFTSTSFQVHLTLLHLLVTRQALHKTVIWTSHNLISSNITVLPDTHQQPSNQQAFILPPPCAGLNSTCTRAATRQIIPPGVRTLHHTALSSTESVV